MSPIYTSMGGIPLITAATETDQNKPPQLAAVFFTSFAHLSLLELSSVS
jgi:hypothetical protein